MPDHRPERPPDHEPDLSHYRRPAFLDADGEQLRELAIGIAEELDLTSAFPKDEPQVLLVLDAPDARTTITFADDFEDVEMFAVQSLPAPMQEQKGARAAVLLMLRKLRSIADPESDWFSSLLLYGAAVDGAFILAQAPLQTAADGSCSLGSWEAVVELVTDTPEITLVIASLLVGLGVDDIEALRDPATLPQIGPHVQSAPPGPTPRDT